MNLRSFRYFLRATEYNSLTQAALALHISQPSLTQHLKHLEDHFGMPLLMRHGRGIVLTEAGNLLRLKGEMLIEQIDGLRDELESRAALPRGTLSVGMPISWSEVATYDAIDRFRRCHPDVRIKLLVDSSAGLATAMTNNEIQFAVLTEVDDLSQFLWTPIVEDEMFLVGPASSGLNGLEPISIAMLANRPMIRPLNATLVVRRLDRAMADLGFALNVVAEAPTANILPLVARGGGFTVLAAGALPTLGENSAFEAVQIKDLPMRWAVATPRNRSRTAAVTAFEAILTEQIAQSISNGKWKTAKLLTGAS